MKYQGGYRREVGGISGYKRLCRLGELENVLGVAGEGPGELWKGVGGI